MTQFFLALLIIIIIIIAYNVFDAFSGDVSDFFGEDELGSQFRDPIKPKTNRAKKLEKKAKKKRRGHSHLAELDQEAMLDSVKEKGRFIRASLAENKSIDYKSKRKTLHQLWKLQYRIWHMVREYKDYRLRVLQYKRIADPSNERKAKIRELNQYKFRLENEIRSMSETLDRLLTMVVTVGLDSTQFEIERYVQELTEISDSIDKLSLETDTSFDEWDDDELEELRDQESVDFRDYLDDIDEFQSEG